MLTKRCNKLIMTDYVCGYPGILSRKQGFMFFIGSSNGKGRGVFAQKRFCKGDIIERSPVIVIPKHEEGLLEGTVLYNYTYGWGEGLEDSAIALGFGSLYNHAYRPNAMYKRMRDDMMIVYVALRDIAEGEEITVNYNGQPGDQSPLWFKVAAE